MVIGVMRSEGKNSTLLPEFGFLNFTNCIDIVCEGLP